MSVPATSESLVPSVKDGVPYLLYDLDLSALAGRFRAATQCTPLDAVLAVKEYRRFLVLKYIHFDEQETQFAPSPMIEQVWRLHRLDSFSYISMCLAIGMWIHRVPPNAAAEGKEESNLKVRRQNTKDRYHANWEEWDETVWDMDWQGRPSTWIGLDEESPPVGAAENGARKRRRTGEPEPSMFAKPDPIPSTLATSKLVPASPSPLPPWASAPSSHSQSTAAPASDRAPPPPLTPTSSSAPTVDRTPYDSLSASSATSPAPESPPQPSSTTDLLSVTIVDKIDGREHDYSLPKRFKFRTLARVYAAKRKVDFARLRYEWHRKAIPSGSMLACGEEVGLGLKNGDRIFAHVLRKRRRAM